MKMTGYKGFDKDLKCRDFQFEVGKEYEHDGKVKLCKSGFHFCENPQGVFGHYAPGNGSRFAIVEAGGVSDERESDSKRVAKKLKIKSEISVFEMCRIAVDVFFENFGFKKKIESAEGNSAGDSGAASAGDYGAASAGDYGAASAGDYSPAVRLKWEAKPLYSERITRYGKDGSNMSSRPSAKTSNARDIPSSRLLFRLAPSARRTGGTGCGSSQGALLPTPAVMEDRRKPNGDTERQKKLMSNLNPYSIAELLPTPVTQGLKVQDGDGSMRPMPLELLPTPRAKDWKGGQVVEGKTVTRLSGETYSSSIGDLARSGLLPTPVSTDIHHERRTRELKEAGAETMSSRRNGESRPNGIADWLDFHGLLPTTKAQEARGNVEVDRGKRNLTDEVSKMIPHSRQTGGATSQLNPLFVAEMMGFPREWLIYPFLGRNGGRNQ